MTITLTQTNYEENKYQIALCQRGEMCKIMETTNLLTGSVSYTIEADIISGWSFLSDHSFHGTDNVITWKRTGLGVFLLIDHTPLPDGTHVLRFTDDLNPDIP